MNDHESVKDLLQREALEVEPVRQARLVAAVYRKNRLICVAPNLYKSHPLQARFGRVPEAIFLHAEVNAIRLSLREVEIEDFPSLTMYVGRVLKNGSLALAKPCAGCRSAIQAFGIRKTFYTDYSGNLVRLTD